MADISPENNLVPLDQIQKEWREIRARLDQLEVDRHVLERENKSLRGLLERVIDNRQKSHTELVMILSTLVGKLPINDVGPIVARLVEHNTNLGQYLAALAKGTADADMPQQTVLKTLEHAKRDLLAAVAPAVEEFLNLDAPFERQLLKELEQDPDLFSSPKLVRANRCFIKGLVPRERILREFGESALMFFNDVTTDPKLNRNPKPEEISLAFRSDFEALLQQYPSAIPRQGELLALYQQVQRSKAPGPEARAQRVAFQKLSFVLELLHYYQHQNTEAPDLIFAQRLPALIEQLTVPTPTEALDEKHIREAENLLALITSPEHRLMIINNLGKSGGPGRTLKYVLRLRETGKGVEFDQVVAEFVKHLVQPPPEQQPTAETLTVIVRLIHPEMQREVVKALFHCERIRKDDAERLARDLGTHLGLQGMDQQLKNAPSLPPEMERQLAWEKIKELIARRADPATVAASIRERLHAKYDVEEIRQSWITLTEADSISLIRVFCHLPYLPGGKTDPIARTILETYVTRLMHEKYAATLQKVVVSLKSMHRAKPDSPTLQSFVALVRWVDPEAANRLCAQIGIAGEPTPA